MLFGPKARDTNEVASVAPFNSAGQLLFGLRKDTKKWALPGGRLLEGEVPQRGALRELLEETTLVPTEMSFLGNSPNTDGVVIHSFRATVRGEPSNQLDPDGEFDRFVWVTPGSPEWGEVMKFLHNPYNVTLELLGADVTPRSSMKKAETTYFEDLPKEKQEEHRQKRALSIAKLDALSYPFDAEFAGEPITVLGQAKNFEPYTDEPPHSLMCEGKHGRFLAFGTSIKTNGAPLVHDSGHRSRPKGYMGFAGVDPFSKSESGFRPIGIRAGSQGGEWFEAPNGERHFGKPPYHQHRQEGEHIANQIYRLFGVSAPETQIKDRQGEPWLFSKRIVGRHPVHSKELHGSDLHEGFVEDAWLANWDVLGRDYDNIILDNNKAHRIDNGGTMFWRAQGARRPFGKEVNELWSMRDPSTDAGRAFHPITDLHAQEKIINFSNKYNKLKPKIDEIVDKSSLPHEVKIHLSNALHDRAKWIGSEGLAKMSGVELKKAISSIAPGKELPSGEHDYSHVLSPEQRTLGYSLRVDPSRGSGMINVLVDHGGTEVGDLSGFHNGEQLSVGDVAVDKAHQGKGLGQAMYEALYAHGYHKHGIREVLGGYHSTSAGRVHQKLAAKHGLSYNPGKSRFAVPGAPEEPYDAARGEYRYALKNELEKMAIADIKAGRKSRIPKSWPTSIGAGDRTWYKYNHVLPGNVKGLDLYVVHHTDNNRIGAFLYSGGGNVGMLTGDINRPGRLYIGTAVVKEGYRGKGLGKAMYEALYAHSHHKHDVKTVWGDEHSTSASRVHSALAEKHGLNYVPAGSERHEGIEEAPFDARFGPYQYTIKSELEKAQHEIDFRGIVRASTPKGKDYVDHAIHANLTPEPVKPGADTYKQLQEMPKIHRRTVGSDLEKGVSRKVVFKGPGETRFMVKPYHERPLRRCDWVHYPIQGWAEMTNQALYHAGGIGHLHQKVHVAEHDMGVENRKEPGLVVELSPGYQTLGQAWANMGGRLPEHMTDENKFDVKRIALMDFLTNNLDRHMGNLLYNPESKSVLAVDHSRSFQYVSPVVNEGPRFRPDPLYGYYGNGVEFLLDLPWNSRGRLPAQKQADLELEFLRSHVPVFDWWNEAAPHIKAAMNDHLKSIKDEKVRDHIRDNFDTRTAVLDEIGDIGIENYDFGHIFSEMKPLRLLPKKFQKNEQDVADREISQNLHHPDPIIAARAATRHVPGFSIDNYLAATKSPHYYVRREAINKPLSPRITYGQIKTLGPEHALPAVAAFWETHEENPKGHTAPTVLAFQQKQPIRQHYDHNGDRGDSHPLYHHIGTYAKAIQVAVLADPKIEKKDIDGKPHVLVHRGIRHDTVADAAQKGHGLKVPSTYSSWSTVKGVARDFAFGSLPGEPEGAVISKWMPVEDILHSGSHEAFPGHTHKYPEEKELVFQHPQGYIRVEPGELSRQ